MWKLIGKVTLRNPRLIYSDSEGDFKVVSQARHGEEYTHPVEAAVVNYVQQKLGGQTIVVADAQELLEHAPKRLKIPYDNRGDGYKLHFYAQDVLIILVARRQAKLSKSGQKYEYTVTSVSKEKQRRRRKKGLFTSH